MKKYKLIYIVLLVVLALTGCQNKPESSLIKNKDMNKLIEQAKKTPSPKISDKPKEELMEMEEKYDSYKTTINDDKLKVSVNVDAKVDIPKVDKMSVLRVKQKKISQKLLDKVRKYLLGDKELYDGGATNVQTKEQIEDEISLMQERIKDVKSTSDDEAILKEYQDHIDEYKEKYETAPDKVDVTKGKIDGKIHTVKEKVKEGKFKDFYEWQLSGNPDGDVFYGISDASDGWYESLYVQNNKNYANCIRYSKVKDSYLHSTKVISVLPTDIGEGSMSVCPADQDISKTQSKFSSEGDELVSPKCENENLAMTEEEALTKAKDFVKNIGLDDFVCSESGLFNEIMSNEIYRKVYIFKFVRSIDGVILFTDGEKFADGNESGEYVKRLWPTESLEVKINDEGIIEFAYNAPLEVTETIVDKSNMKSFEEIKGIFEKMIVVANAQKEYKKDIQIDAVELRYERISEKDSFDTGLLIPAWDFVGQSQCASELLRTGSMITINAIDGSVIDRQLGY